MKKIYSWSAAVVILFVTMDALSQRMRYDQTSITYTRPPLEPLDTKVKMYSIEFLHGPEISMEELNLVKKQFNEFVCEPLTRDYTETSRGKENVLFVRIRLKPFHAEQAVLHEESTFSGSSAERKSYHYTIAYEYPMQLEVYLGQRSEPVWKAFETSKKFIYTSSKEATPSLRANNAFGVPIHDEMKENAIRSNMARIREAVRSRHAYSVLTTDQKVWSPKTTKKIDYTDLDSAQNKALRAFRMIAPAPVGITRYRELIQESITLWLEVLKESNLQDKKSRINAEVTSSIRHNLAYSYYWLGDIDKAEEQAKIAAQEYKETSWTEDILPEIEEYKKRVQGNQTSKP